MLRLHALCGVSALAIQAALLASTGGASAQTRELPPVSVDAPRLAPSTARKPASRTAGARTRSAKRSNMTQLSAPAVATDGSGAGAVHGAFDTPAAVARYQLPQQSLSITARQMDETINLKDPEDAVKYMPPFSCGSAMTATTRRYWRRGVGA